MATKLYTSAFAEASSRDAPAEVRRVIEFLERQPDVSRVYQVARASLPRNERDLVAVGAELRLGQYLPSRLDPAQEGMQPTEPVVFLFDAERYPNSAPIVGSDRKDFAWQGKPHISQPTSEFPPLFCLSRAPLDDWFAEHGFPAFFDRLFDWLIDAAQGKLQREDGRFEPTMVPSVMPCVFDYDRTASWIKGQRKISRKPDYKYAQFRSVQEEISPVGQESPRLTLWFDGPRAENTAKLYLQEVCQSEEEGRAHGGFAAWMKEGGATARHFSTLPATRSELIDWGRELGIEIAEPMEVLVEAAQSAGRSWFLIPMLFGVQRPNALFGVESDLEILPILYWRGEEGNEQVFFMRHQHLHTADRARQLSQTGKIQSPVTLIGGGALGSKIFDHWYRGGQTDWTLIDGDVLAPHNLTRHSLEPSAEGHSKVAGLLESIEGMFKGSSGERGVVETAVMPLTEALRDERTRGRMEGSLIIDTTASAAALQEVTSEEMPSIAGAARGFIVDEGRKAALLLEGSNRNPRLDDARAYLYQMGTVEDDVADWLSRRSQQENAVSGLRGEEIEVGLGCASDTFRLSDDEVSLHAAQLSMRLRRWLGAHEGPVASSDCISVDQNSQIGKAGLSSAGGRWREWDVPSVIIIDGSEWQLRVTEKAAAEMSRLRQQYAPDETGGVVLGQINHNRRIAYVTQALPPPRDSTHAPMKFVRGTEGVQASLERTEQRTGGMIGYVAEWHSHPRGPRQLGGKDFQMARQTRRRYRGSTFPAVVIVSAPSGLAVHVEMEGH